MNRLSAPILVATDASEDAHTAIRVAASLARRSGSPLHIVHVWQMPFTYGLALPLAFDPGLKDAAGAAILDEERALAEGFGAEVAGAHLRHGTPAYAILAVAETVNAGMIVVGRRGLGAVRRVVLGSVSDGVVQQATVPVLVVHGNNWPPSRVVVGDDGSDEARAAADVAADVAAAVGAPVEALDDAAQDATSLVVVGHHRSVDGQHPRRNSVAGRVLHHAAGSVLVVPACTVTVRRAQS